VTPRVMLMRGFDSFKAENKNDRTVFSLIKRAIWISNRLLYIISWFRIILKQLFETCNNKIFV
jgi:hypothetical protein